MKKRQIIVVVVGLTIVFGSITAMNFLGAQRVEPEKEKPVENKKFVKTTKVEYQDIPTTIVAYGRVNVTQSLDLISEQAGRMYQADVLLKEGQKFKKGDLLFQIDNKEASLKLQSLKSNFIRDLASIAPDLKVDFPERYDVWLDYYRSIKLDKALGSLPSEMSEKERTFMATKNILGSYYDIKSQEVNLAKYNYYAPFNGSITMVNLQSGSYVSPGANIGRIIRSDRLEIKVDVPVNEIAWVSKGTQVEIDTEDGTQKWKGYISRISEVLNQNTQSLDVYISISQNGNALYDGQYLRATIPGRDVFGAMEIPRNALVDNSHVFTVTDSLLQMKQISVHKITAQTIVFNGLEEGTDLVVEPLVNVSNNMKVFKLEDRQQVTEADSTLGTEISSAVAQK